MHRATMDEVIQRASADCETCEECGVDGAIVENFGDAPFSADRVEPVTVAAMTAVAYELKRNFPNLRFGINVLRNDAVSALSIATAVSAEFIRVNVHVGAVLTDQGIIQGKAYETLRLRKNLDASVKIFADVDVKHSAGIGDYGILAQAADALERGLADAIILSGQRTGSPVDLSQLKDIRKKFSHARIIIGSGANYRNVRHLMRFADSVIVGTSVKKDRVTANPFDPRMLREFVRAAKS